MSDVIPLANRFRGFLPVVVDVETGGFNEQTDALLQIAAVLIDIDATGQYFCAETVTCHVNLFEGARLDYRHFVTVTRVPTPSSDARSNSSISRFTPGRPRPSVPLEL